jgi:hypothetical protein
VADHVADRPVDSHLREGLHPPSSPLSATTCTAGSTPQAQLPSAVTSTPAPTAGQPGTGTAGTQPA